MEGTPDRRSEGIHDLEGWAQDTQILEQAEDIPGREEWADIPGREEWAGDIPGLEEWAEGTRDPEEGTHGRLAQSEVILDQEVGVIQGLGE